jgi:flagellar biosynthesis protein FliQ
MDLDNAIDLVRDATQTVFVIGAPLLAISLLVSLATSFLQAVTQIHEQALSQIPKIALMSVALLVLLPWVMQRVVDYATTIFHEIPSRL